MTHDNIFINGKIISVDQCFGVYEASHTPWRAVGAADLQPANDGDHFQEMAQPVTWDIGTGESACQASSFR